MDDVATAHDHLEESFRLIQREQGWHEIALRLAARDAPDRRPPPRRRHRRRRRAGRGAAAGLPVVHRPRLRARPWRPASGATSTRRAGAVRALPRDGRRAGAVRRHGRPRLVPGPRGAGQRRRRRRATPPPRSRASRRASSGSPPTCRSASSWPTCCCARRDADPAAVLAAAGGDGQRHRHLVAVPRHRVLRARPRRAGREPVPRARSRATPRTRPPRVGLAEALLTPAPLRRSSSDDTASCRSARRRSSPCSARGSWPRSRPATPERPRPPPTCSPSAAATPTRPRSLGAFARLRRPRATPPPTALPTAVRDVRRAHARRARAARGVRAVRAARPAACAARSATPARRR